MQKSKSTNKNSVNFFMTKRDEYRISVQPQKKGCIILGIDIGLDGFFANLNSDEVNQLISMLKQAKKESMAQ